MAIEHLTTENFDTAIAEGKTLVDFWATWCGPCRMQAPILEQLDAELNGAVKIAKIDVDNEVELARRYQIMSIPSLILFEDGKLVDKRVGVQGISELKQMLAE